MGLSQRPSIRRSLTVIHRYVGLGLAVFLFLAGTTGAVIAWEREVDHFINPQIFVADSTRHAAANQPPGHAKSVYELARIVERHHPEFRVTYLQLAYSPGNTEIMYVEPTPDPATGKAKDLGFDEIFIDPVTAKIQGARPWGALSLRRECWLPLIYRFHYSLMLPGDWGIWFMGILAMVWTIDCFVALWISFPSPKHWIKSFTFNFRRGLPRALFDLHRSGGVWVWPLLLVIAVTSIWMNLAGPVVKPMVALFSNVRHDSAYDRPRPEKNVFQPKIDRQQIVQLATAEARRHGITDPPGALGYSPRYAIYSVGFFASEEDHAGHGSFGWQPAWFSLDAQTGAVLGSDIPGTGSWGDHLLDLQFPLHTGRIIGTAGKAIVSILGLVVAMLSVTGVWLWARRRLAARRWNRTAPRSAAIAGPDETTHAMA